MFGFRTSDLRGELSELYQKSAQIRSELTKSKVRGLVEKVQGKNLYIVTEPGFKIIWIKLSSNSYLCDPLITMTYRKNGKPLSSQPYKLDEAYALINNGLDLIIYELFIEKAAKKTRKFLSFLRGNNLITNTPPFENPIPLD